MTIQIVQETDTSIPLLFTIEGAGGGVTGQSPTVALRNSSTIDSYLDFSDNTFKTVGWTLKDAPLTEVGNGHYQRLVNISVISVLSPGSVLSAEFHVDDGGGVKGDAADLLVIVKSLYDIAGDVWEEAIVDHQTAGTFGPEVSGGVLTAEQAVQLLEIYRILGLDPTTPLIVSETARSAGPIDQTVQKNVPAAGSVKVSRN